MTDDELRLERAPAAVVAPGRRSTRSDGRGSRSSTRTTTSASPFGGEWAGRSAAELVATLDASGVETIVDLDGGQGEALSAEIERWARPRPGPGRRRSPASTTTRWATDPAFGETEAARLRDSVAAGRPRAEGLEAARAAGARPGRPARRRRRPAPRPAVGGRRRAGAPGRHPHRRSDRVLRAARRDERALGGAPRPPGLALLADATRRRPRRARASRRSTRCWRRSGGSSPGTRGRRSSAPTSAARRRTSALVGAAARREPEPLRRHRGAARRARPAAVHGRAFFLRYADRILFGVDMAPDPAIYAIHYRFLETFDESFDYGTDAVPGQGRWQIHGIGLPDDVLRKVYRDNARRLLRLASGVTGPGSAAPIALGTRRGLDGLRLGARHVRGPRPRPPPEPAQGAAPGRPGLGHVRRDGRVQAGGRPGARAGRDRDAARPGDRGGPVHRRRVAAGAAGLLVAIEATGLRRAVDGAGQPRARGLERRAGEADGRVGREAARLLPPGGVERRRPGAARRRRVAPPAARRTSRSSWSRSRSRWSRASRWSARRAGASSSRPRAG